MFESESKQSNEDFLREFDSLVNSALVNCRCQSMSSNSSSSGISEASNNSFKKTLNSKLNFNHEFNESFKISKQQLETSDKSCKKTKQLIDTDLDTSDLSDEYTPKRKNKKHNLNLKKSCMNSSSVSTCSISSKLFKNSNISNLIIEMLVLVLLKNSKKEKASLLPPVLNNKPILNSLIRLVESKSWQSILATLLTPSRKSKSKSKPVKSISSTSISDISSLSGSFNEESDFLNSTSTPKQKPLEIPNIEDPCLFIDTVYNQLLANKNNNNQEEEPPQEIALALGSPSSCSSKTDEEEVNSIANSSRLFCANDFSFIDLYSDRTNEMTNLSNTLTIKDGCLNTKRNLIDWNYELDEELDEDDNNTCYSLSSINFNNIKLDATLNDSLNSLKDLKEKLTLDQNWHKKFYTNKKISFSTSSLLTVQTNHEKKYFQRFYSHGNLYSLGLEKQQQQVVKSKSCLVESKENEKSFLGQMWDSVMKSIKFILITKNVILLPIVLYFLNTKLKCISFTSSFSSSSRSALCHAVPTSSLTTAATATATAAATATLNSLVAYYTK